LSYGETLVTVDFVNHSLICLSGKNGHGKSALLDAITWALWGQARKVSGTAKADAGLIRLGQTRMMVNLEFICNGQRYRVSREYAKTYGKPYAALNLELFDSASNSYRSLSEKTIKQTQEKIEKVVSLDFETFVNSAFLRQGQSNEFSQKTPAERKQILANILGLSRYDDMSKLSLEYGRRYTEDGKILQKLQEQSVEELSQENAISLLLEQKKQDLTLLEQELIALGNEVQIHEKEKLLWMQKKYQYEQMQAERVKLEQLLVKNRQKLQQGVVLWRKTHGASIAGCNVQELEVLRKKLFEQEKVFRDQHRQDMLLQEQIVALKGEHQKEVNACKQEYDTNLSKHMLVCERAEFSYKQLVTTIGQKKDLVAKNREKRDKVARELQDISKELVRYPAFSKEFEFLRRQFEKRKLFYQNLAQQGNWVQAELKELIRKKTVIHNENDPSCPLCEQVLTVKRKQFLARTLGKQEQFLQHRLARLMLVSKKLKALLCEQHEQMQSLQFQDDRFKQLDINKKTLEKALIELDAEQARDSVEYDLLQIRLQKELGDLELLRKVLDEKKKAPLISPQVEVLAKKLVQLEEQRKLYDKVRHDALLEELHTCEHTLQGFEEIKAQIAQQGERRKNISLLCIDLKNLKTEILVLLEKEKLFNLTQGSVIEKQLGVLKDKLNQFMATKEKWLQERGSLESKQARFIALKKEYDVRRGKIEQVNQQAKEYQVLAQLFGKDGIQALLIEQSIPEIEQEANKLLASLTDNKSQIFIESLRDLKSGGVRESLDIHISDPSGIRPYEMFSGGEAFRIDFALRIAISKLLARRAGTALQTLIIDEGFGSQDEDGLQRLMDAIYAIQKDFEKIIVVSHLPIFKNNFPVHFMVEKDSFGSTVSIEERG
jgi:ATPase involved in DNA repair